VAQVKLTDEEQAEIERFRNLLYPEVEEIDLISGKPVKRRVEGPVLKQYKVSAQEWEDAVLEYNTLRIKAQNPNTPEEATRATFDGPTLRHRVTRALGDWNVNGHKEEVEKIQALIQAVTQRDLNLWKADLLDRFETSRVADGLGQEFFPTSLVPAGFAASSQGWSTFKFSHKEVEHFSKARASQWDVSGGIGFGGFSIGGGGGGTSSSMLEVKNSTNFECSFGVTQIPILRAWFDPTFLESRAWRLAPTTVDLTFLSDGGKPPKGMLVGYPTSVIFARDITVNFDELHDKTTELHKTLKTHGSGGWGPFKVGGSYSRDNQDKSQETELTDNGLVMKGLQIIGFRCHLLNKAPNPLPTIKDFV
jgi:hypothetical protein